MTVDRVPMTVTGEQQLRSELEQLKSVDRLDVIKAIAEARAHGDLRENAEYHAAKERQGFIEGRISEIEAKLSCAQVIDVTKITNSGRVIFGATVDVINHDTNEAITYQIVGDDEADLKQQKISVNSPIARGLIGKEEGDDVTVDTPSGKISYEIKSVEYT